MGIPDRMTVIMEENRELAAQKLKRLRSKTNLGPTELSKALGRPQKSGYTYYEDGYKKEFLPLEIFLILKPIFIDAGIPEEEFDTLMEKTPGGIGGVNKGIGRYDEEELFKTATTTAENLLTARNVPIDVDKVTKIGAALYKRMVKQIEKGQEPDPSTLSEDAIEIIMDTALREALTKMK